MQGVHHVEEVVTDSWSLINQRSLVKTDPGASARGGIMQKLCEVLLSLRGPSSQV